MAKWSRNLVLFTVIFLFGSVRNGTAQQIPDEVLDIFDNSCAFSGCHAGPNAPNGLDLTEEYAFATLVNQPSKSHSSFMRVKPQDPVRSYLIMKIKGTPGIKGDRMPRSGDPLSDADVAVLANWIESLPADAKMAAPEREYAQAFPGISLATVPTAETIEKGMFSYRIAHRWVGKVEEGFDTLFGLDFGARMYTQLSFAITNNIMFNVGRSRENQTFEFGGKVRLLREKNDGSVPLSVAIIGGVDWATRKNISGVETSRTDGDRFAWFGQLALSKQVHERISVLLVPGILLNGNVNVPEEDALITLAFAAKVMLLKDFSLFVEGVPILSGDDDSNPIRSLYTQEGKIFDSFTVGLERKIGGHVFHVYVTNSLGLTAGQYMSGAELDFMDADFRLGFNIYRLLNLPF